MKDLNRRAWLGLFFLAVIMSLLIFLAAGTVRYWQAWVYLGIFFGISVLITLHLMKKDPGLLKRRLSGGPAAEKSQTQKAAMRLVSLGFIGLIVVSALDHRFGWSNVPLYMVIVGDALTVVAFYITFHVYKANTYASATIEVTNGQEVISTGPYAIVRHPMYTGGLFYLLGMPLALGSYWGLLVFAVTLPALLWRLLDEEEFLAKKLPGYVEYQAKVRWRLIPRIF